MFGQVENGDLRQIDLLPPGQVEKEVERPLPTVDVERQLFRGLGRPRTGEEIVLAAAASKASRR